MKKWKIVCCFVVTFVAGAVVGGTLSFPLMRHVLLQPPNSQQMEEKFLRELRSDLKLSDEQVTLVRPILAKTADEVTFYHRSAFKKVGELLRAGDEDIKKVLTDEQKARFEKFQQHRPPLPPAN